VDANASLGFDDASSLLRKLGDLGVASAEQPLAAWDLDGMAELARRLNMPIIADESVATVHDLVEVVKRRAASVVQTKSAKNGGVWRVQRLWSIAEAAGIGIYPGNHPCTSIGAAAVAHLAVAWPGELLDGPFAVGISGLLARDVVTEPLVPRRARIAPCGPGFGVELDMDAVDSLRVD
jgi:muconate cycloisomerase